MGLLRSLDKATYWNYEGEQTGDTLLADVYRNVPTAQGTLSVFRVEGPEQIQMVAAALAARRDNLRQVDYCVFESEIVDRLGIEQEETAGDTAVVRANSLHVDLKSLTARKLLDLIVEVAKADNLGKVRVEAVETQIRQLVEDGELDINRMPTNLRAKLGY